MAAAAASALAPIAAEVGKEGVKLLGDFLISVIKNKRSVTSGTKGTKGRFNPARNRRTRRRRKAKRGKGKGPARKGRPTLSQRFAGYSKTPSSNMKDPVGYQVNETIPNSSGGGGGAPSANGPGGNLTSIPVGAKVSNVMKDYFQERDTPSSDPFARRFTQSTLAEGQELLANLDFTSFSTTPKIGEFLFTMMLNPLQLEGTRLKKLAQLYQRFKFNYIELIWTPDVGTSANGSMIMSHITDASLRIKDTGITAVRKFMETFQANKFQVALPATFTKPLLQPDCPFYMKYSAAPTVTGNMVNQGYVGLMAGSTLALQNFGSVFLKYSCTLYDPIVNDDNTQLDVGANAVFALAAFDEGQATGDVTVQLPTGIGVTLCAVIIETMQSMPGVVVPLFPNNVIQAGTIFYGVTDANAKCLRVYLNFIDMAMDLNPVKGTTLSTNIPVRIYNVTSGAEPVRRRLFEEGVAPHVVEKQTSKIEALAREREQQKTQKHVQQLNEELDVLRSHFAKMSMTRIDADEMLTHELSTTDGFVREIKHATKVGEGPARPEYLNAVVSAIDQQSKKMLVIDEIAEAELKKENADLDMRSALVKAKKGPDSSSILDLIKENRIADRERQKIELARTQRRLGKIKKRMLEELSTSEEDEPEELLDQKIE